MKPREIPLLISFLEAKCEERRGQNLLGIQNTVHDVLEESLEAAHD